MAHRRQRPTRQCFNASRAALRFKFSVNNSPSNSGGAIQPCSQASFKIEPVVTVPPLRSVLNEAHFRRLLIRVELVTGCGPFIPQVTAPDSVKRHANLYPRVIIIRRE